MTQPTDPISVTLQAQAWNVVLAGLGELPWRVADAVIREIATQAGAATEAPLAAKPNGTELTQPAA
jgi:hypothetical protein